MRFQLWKEEMEAKILVIDDEEIVRLTIEGLLSKEGYEVLTAEGYTSAMEVISTCDLDLIFVDIALGEHTGIEFLRAAKNQGLTCPIVMITGYPNIETASEALRLGAFDYLAKPIRRDSLLRAALLALNHKTALDQKALAEANQESYRRHLEAIFRSVTDAIVTVNREMRVTGANEAARIICGTNPEDITGKEFDEAFHLCNKSCRKVLRQLLETEEMIGDHQVRCEHKHRPGQIVVLTGAKLKGQDNKFLGAVLVIKDTTRLTELERELKVRGQFHKIVGKSIKMQDIYGLIENLADVETTVLINGESGTGKELVAEALHYSGSRSSKPLVKVNCAALSENLLESELFGHARGSFTGAEKDRTGRFQLADGGTIFLDEIGDISLRTQVKLLRTLEEKTFERVGDSVPIKVDIRVLASTNIDLMEKVKRGEFREDLYYRLRVLKIELPPLRERREDIPLLINHFCEFFKRHFGKPIDGVSDEAVEMFMQYHWPGNVRELKHAIEHAFILCSGRLITIDHLPAEIMEGVNRNVQASKGSLVRSHQDILKTLNETGGNKSEAARRLGISRQTIYRKINKKQNKNKRP
jgi:two-component system response regulator HydG